MTVIELIQKLSKATNVYAQVSAMVGCDGYGTTASITDVTDMGVSVLIGLEEEHVKDFMDVMKDVEDK